MKRLGRSFVPALFSCLILFSVAFNLPHIAQQTPNPPEQIPSVRPDADSMLLDVAVIDKKGTYVDGLDQNAFALYDNKVPQEITFFAGGGEPASIGLILDLSGSMDEKKLKTARNAVLRFMELSNSANDYFFIAFAGRARLLTDWTRDGKIAAEEFSKYNITTMRGPTALYDACYLAVEKMMSGAHPKQAILLITDGVDNESSYTYSNVRERLKETGVTLYSIVIVPEQASGFGPVEDDRTGLDELSALSGGKAYFLSSAKMIDETFDRIAKELRHQYLIGFRPENDKGDDKWHQIKVKVTPPLTTTGKQQNLVARSRMGYYPNKDYR
jgi:Ca-activated chloride channel family protein